jgi:hypothetical protein
LLSYPEISTALKVNSLVIGFIPPFNPLLVFTFKVEGNSEASIPVLLTSNLLILEAASMPLKSSCLTSHTIFGDAAIPLLTEEEFISELLLEGPGSDVSSSCIFTCPYKFVEAPPYSGLSDKWILGVAVPVTLPLTSPIISPSTTVKSPAITELPPALSPPSMFRLFEAGSKLSPNAFLIGLVSELVLSL